MNNQTNTPVKWGVTKKEFEAGTWGSMMPDFRLPIKFVRRFKGDIERAFKELAQMIIDVIVSVNPVLNTMPIHGVKPRDYEFLKKAVYWGMMNVIENNNITQLTKAKSLSTPSFSTNEDVTSWVWAKDMLGVQAWTALQNSQIDDYVTITTNDVNTVITWLKQNGNAEYIGWSYSNEVRNWITDNSREIK